MEFAGLIEGRLVRRYKRFLADVELPDGRQVTAHCPNTGSMRNCAEPGSRVWLLDSGNASRKYPLGWELVEVEGRHLACINTGRANALVREAIEQGRIGELAGYGCIRQEVPYGEERSRIDLVLSQGKVPDAWVEIKNLTLLEAGGWGSFPDAVTLRGQKHLRELMLLAQQGVRAVLLFCVPHGGIERVRPADAIDPAYGRLLREARGSGVELLAYGATPTPRELVLNRRLDIVL
ncbi:DNA/RNA nuclease SfsA [Marinobacterium rhizophilum]|uniref:Sugar fermentation stimulation protein homolog n=1 Tax=Marinobacterium rhizophilum TaxID=420402 RepID=A0ABY5HHY2_9GAMM|nr:DNA/RNA nuclease SfsA [Marinobacterium rhizophilum]UTW10907.1 DNA/RNA nuclease SfsA [Marinobacterium rhizophilum]